MPISIPIFSDFHGSDLTGDFVVPEQQKLKHVSGH